MFFENPAVKFAFDPACGRFSVYDKRRKRFAVRGAAFSVNGHFSTDCSSFSVSRFPFVDALGAGQSVQIVGSDGAGDAVLLRVQLYEERGCVVLRCGYRNAGEESIRICEMFPLLTDGLNDSHVSLGGDPHCHHRVLTGEGGFSYPRLLDKVDATSLNVMTVVRMERPDCAAAVLAGLTTFEFQTEISVHVAENSAPCGFAAQIRQFDATGKLVDAGCDFWGDAAYLDISEPDPYAALESYAACVAKAMDVQLNNYNDYISVCLWYVFAFSCGDRSANTSCGALQEAQAMIDSGITKYAPPLVRLVPDEYVNPNEQLWWDEEHWRRYVHLTEPLETLKKWIDAMHAIGAEGGLYMQPTFRSDDYCHAHPEHMLFNKEENAADYTDPAFLQHMREVYATIRDAGVIAMFYDYTMLVRGDIRADINALLEKGGFDDPYATSVSAYRNIFKIAKDVVGRRFMITENTWNYSGQELATGVIDAQRSKMDNVGMNPEVVKSGVRQWYRNKVTKLIDPDVKNFTTADADIRRKEISLMGLLFGKTMLGSSISRYHAADIRDIGRILPMPLDGKTARPVDLFLSPSDGNARVYDYPLNDGAHILALLNETHSQLTLSVELGEKPVFGGLSLDAGTQYDLWDFWNERYLGRVGGNAVVRQTLRKNECRLVTVRPVREKLQLLSTNRHILQGVVESTLLEATADTLTMRFSVVANDPFRAVVALPQKDMQILHVQAWESGVTCRAEKDPFSPIVYIELNSDKNIQTVVRLVLGSSAHTAAKPPRKVTGLTAAADVSQGVVHVHWDAAPDVRYALFKNGELLLHTTETVYADASVEENATYTYAVIAENADGVQAAPETVTVSTGRFIPSLTYGPRTGENVPLGRDGCVLFNHAACGSDEKTLPSYLDEITVIDRKDHRFNAKPGDPRALVGKDGSAALGAVCNDKMLELSLRFRDDAAHEVTLYCVDFERSGRTMDIEVTDADGGICIPARNIPEYGEGVFIRFPVTGTVRIRLTNHAVNAVVNAVFFD